MKLNRLFLAANLLTSSPADTLYQDIFDGDGLSNNSGIGGGLLLNNISNASWLDEGDASFSTGNENFRRRALIYSENAFQSNEGLKLTVKYVTGSIVDTGAHDLSFGLISTDTDLSTYTGVNPFKRDPSIYGVGINVTPEFDPETQGLTVSNGTEVRALDQSGTNTQFKEGTVSEAVFAIGKDGAWSYSIDGVQEAVGVVPEGFDLRKHYHVVVYGQDDNGGGKSIESIQLESAAPEGLDPYAEFLYHDGFDGDGLANNIIKGGGLANVSGSEASWSDNGQEAQYDNGGVEATNNALMYSLNSFQSETGFNLHVEYETDRIGNSGSHNLSFGLVSADTDLANYDGGNPFQAESALYSIGANLTTDAGAGFRGLNFANGSSVLTLDTAGTRQQFVRGESAKVTIEINRYGYWCYRINGEYEASGALPEDFDLTKRYHIVVYGQDGVATKSIQSITLEQGYDQGERAEGLRGSWNAGQGDSDALQTFKTIDSTLARVNEGASVSAEHNLPHRLLEMIAAGVSSVGGAPLTGESIPVHPTWGDFDDDEPDSDAFLEDISDIRNAGLGAKFYSNSANFAVGNSDELEVFAQRWFEWCDTNPEAQAFINSQPYHTGVWNSNTQQYEDASNQFPRRKYLFCYAEFVLKDISLRYGEYATSWIFDASNSTMIDNGDDPLSGIPQEQRIYQAFANAVWSGNPDCPVAFNNGRQPNSGFQNDPAFPYALPTRFEDFTFGHAHGANNDHASMTLTSPARENESLFVSNVRHVTRMATTNGFVHEGGDRSFDDKVVGNYHSKLGPASWRFSTPPAWTQDDFNQLNLDAVRSGGHMTWEGSVPRSQIRPPLSSTGLRPLRDLELGFLRNTDDYLCANEAPDRPSWSRAFTDLPPATIGEQYSHILVEGEDFYDENNDIISLSAVRDGFFSSIPSWLTITESNTPGEWILSGTPTNPSAETLSFNLNVRNENNLEASRTVDIVVNGADGAAEFTPILPGGLIAEWQFEEGSGTVVADNVTGTYPATRATGEWITGPCGGAMSFDGTQAGLILPAGAFTEVTANNQVSLSMWVNGDTSQAIADTIFNAQDNAGSRILNIHLPWGNEVVFWDAGGDRLRNTATPEEYEGSWRHWIFTKNAATGEMIVYLDGQEWAKAIGQTGRIDTIDSIVLGNSVEGNSGYTGAIDEVRLYSRVLNPVEALTLHDFYEDKPGYDVWFNNFAGGNAASSVSASVELDFDGDGIPNLLEYALAGDPASSEAHCSVPEIIYSESDEEFVFRYIRNTDSVIDTRQTFQYSSDLDGFWNSINLTGTVGSGVRILNLSDDLQQVDVLLESIELFDQNRMFGRLEVILEE